MTVGAGRISGSRLLADVRPERLAYAAAICAGLVWLLVFPLYTHDQYWQSVLIFGFVFAVMAGGWNIISGYCGYISLGQSAFLGLGAYTTGILTVRYHFEAWTTIPLAGLVSAAAAALLGTVIMRTRGHSFVIITIAFLLILELVAINLRGFTDGTTGITMPLTFYPTKWQNTPFYYVFFFLMLLSVLMTWGIRRTKFGTGLIAIREDEDKAGAVGINTAVYKVLGFAASAVLVGATGGVYGYFLTFIDPTGMFNILYSVFAVLAVLLGGRATIWGPVIGGLLIELLREEANVHFGGSSLDIVIFGGLMAAVVLFLPQGVVPTVSAWLQRRRTRHIPGVSELAIDLRAAGVPVSTGPRGSDRRLLEVDGLEKRFGGVRAVDGLSFHVREGTITGLIGPNGSGKTTAFNLIDGMMKPDGGEVRLDGRRLTGRPTWERAHLGLGRTFQITRLFRRMTVLENVVAPLRAFKWSQLAAGAVAGHEVRRAEELLEFVGMLRFRDTEAGALSYGQQKLVELAQILMLDPKLIMLDEPAGGINPTLIERLAEKIRELNAMGKTFLIVEHNMPLVAELCDPVIVLARGKTIAAGPAAEIQADPEVLDAYLGEGWTADEMANV
ncbi:MAG TPA: branched-chain amino acid ABC transporter ATP-binding protein/permease [Gaiellaceae bacterium]|nr:branched-chain amino acid ABC transporter ATP-binding protein/permease [Gaiellaceae bacterium]